MEPFSHCKLHDVCYIHKGMTAIICSPKRLSKSLIHATNIQLTEQQISYPRYGQCKPRGNPGAGEVVSYSGPWDIDEVEGGVSVCSGNGSGWDRRGSGIDWSNYVHQPCNNKHNSTRF